MFLTTLAVAHVDDVAARGKEWKLTQPLIWRGRWEYFIIRSDFATDFASIPRPIRWLLDNSGRNSEAAVLHDAVWRESKKPADERRVDPWHADGIFRRALRQTGSTALSRGLMWFAVRAAAIRRGRFGKLGPSRIVKLLQLAGMFVVGVLTVLAPTLVAVAGLIVFWAANWIVAVVWHFVESARMEEATNWPWPVGISNRERTAPPERLLVVHESEMPSELVDLLEAKMPVTEADLDRLLPQTG